MRNVLIAVTILVLICSFFISGLWPFALYAAFGAVSAGPATLPSADDPINFNFNIAL